VEVQLDQISTYRPEIQQQIVDIVNGYRRIVEPSAQNMLKVRWDPEAAKTAAAWANKCTFDHSPESERTLSTGIICGENLFMTTVFVGWDVAFEAFWNEKDKFIFGKGATYPGAEYLHYTQLCWYLSHRLGCAVAYCPNGAYRWFFVCHQCPRGNIVPTEYPYVYGPSCGACSNDCDDKLCTNACNYYNLASRDMCKSYQSNCGIEVVRSNCAGTCNCPDGIW
ncbi:hypothetical protein GDO81_025280, partial [Engystomops pustulosus]